jgi:hypothetical protein
MHIRKRLIIVCAALAYIPMQAGVAQAQIWSRPVLKVPPAPPSSSAPCTSNYGPIGNPLPVTAYRFYGPSTGTYTYQLIPVVTQSCDPARPEPVQTFIVAPVMGYSPGYYQWYDSVRFYRN